MARPKRKYDTTPTRKIFGIINEGSCRVEHKITEITKRGKPKGKPKKTRGKTKTVPKKKPSEEVMDKIKVGDTVSVKPATLAKISKLVPLKKQVKSLAYTQRVDLASSLHESLRVLDEHSSFLLTERTKWIKQVTEAEGKLTLVEQCIATRLSPFIIGQNIQITKGDGKRVSATVVGVTFQQELPYYTIWIRYRELSDGFETYSDLVRVDNASDIIGCLDVEETPEVLHEVAKNRLYLEENDLIPTFKLRKVFADEHIPER